MAYGDGSMGLSMGPDMMGDDALGDDVLGDAQAVADMLGVDVGDVLGAVARRRRGMRTGNPRAFGRPGRGLPARALGAPQRLGTPLTGPLGWRAPQLAPGVMAPFEGLVPLPLVPNAGGGTFTSLVNNITFQARPQKPFRGERLVASVRRSAGAGAVLILAQSIFVGTDLQQAFAGGIDIEVFAANSVDVRMVFTAAQPGIEYSILCTPTIAVPVGETVSVSLTVLGRIVQG